MRLKKNEFSLEEALNLWKEKNLTFFKVSSEDIIENWRLIVGDWIANQTLSLCINQKTLQIKVKHSLWRKELAFQSKAIIEKVNQFAQYEIINKIEVL